MNLFKPTRTTCLKGKRYDLVIVDDLSYFTWIIFLAQKDKVFFVFTKFYRKASNKKNLSIICIHSDLEIEFENHEFESFYNKKRI